MAMTKGVSILPCNCEHGFQDKSYGNKKRLHSPMASGQWKCTVCGKVNGAAQKVTAVTIVAGDKPAPKKK